MSLVAYGSSDESSDEEVIADSNETQLIVTNKAPISVKNVTETVVPISKSHLSLPVPKYEQSSENFDDDNDAKVAETKKCTLEFGALPKPKSSLHSGDDVIEEDDTSLFKAKNYPESCVVDDDDIPLFQPKPFVAEKNLKPIKAPARISVPSLSDFKDVDEDLEKSKHRRQPSKQGIGLFAILPPPQAEVATKKNNFIPHVLTKPVVNPAPKKPVTVTKVPEKIVKVVKNPLTTLDYGSNSEDDEGEEDGKFDFFSLSKRVTLPEPPTSAGLNFFSIPEDKDKDDLRIVDDEAVATNQEKYCSREPEVPETMQVDEEQISDTTLVSTVMNMPREQILLKNKAEVGPKLPVPEQEYNVDSAGNVAIDDKAIEYLHGKRGVKRKNKMIDEVNITEINGDDIKPDEREWLIKAMTEEPVQRPISMQGAGPSSQSKKKHQITYLAHQAKAMEVELKNTWSQNRMTRKQTQSKYGF